MNDRTPLDERLEQLTHQALRELPPCAAPASLETRVLREIELRAAGKRRATGIARWPRAARIVLSAVCALCVPLVWLLASRLPSHVTVALANSSVAHAVRSISGTGRTVLDLGELAVHLVHAIPATWLLGGLFVVGAVYAALIALGYLLLYPTLSHSKAHSV